MQRKNIYIISIAVFITTAVVIYFHYQARERNKEDKVYYLLERNDAGANAEEWKEVREQAMALIKKIQDNPEDIASRTRLAGLYIREARVTGNYLYYDRAAMKCVDDVLKRNENNFEALSLKAMVLLSEHHFSDALAVAQKAVSINPYNAFVYGTLVDAYVELGDYQSAVENLEKMISIRPDMRSYARVSYLREIHGDYPGAIEAMKLAVDAGAAGDEATAWTRIQLGHLFEKTGDMKNAEMQYRIAQDERPGYAYALAGLARIATVKKNYDDAISLYHQGDSIIQDYSLKEQLSDVYLLKGDSEKANTSNRQILLDMIGAAKKWNGEEEAGHYSDRELAYAYLKVNDHNNALAHALAEYNRRPENIDVNETVAWVYYARGEYTKALAHLKMAMKTNSKNPTLLCRAGLIYSKAGDRAAAKALLLPVILGNANIAGNLRSEGWNALQTL